MEVKHGLKLHSKSRDSSAVEVNREPSVVAETPLGSLETYRYKKITKGPARSADSRGVLVPNLNASTRFLKVRMLVVILGPKRAQFEGEHVGCDLGPKCARF